MSQIALATVVLPTPAGPVNIRFGTVLSFTKSFRVFLIVSDKIQSSIVDGRYRSTHNKEFSMITPQM
jgi:hypothetical protein